LYNNELKLTIFILESELVSGFMTEHAAVIFVFFFLAEYASIVLICILTSVLFLGGYLLNVTGIIYFVKEVYIIYIIQSDLYLIEGVNTDLYNDVIVPTLYRDVFTPGFFHFFSYPLVEGMLYGLILGLKSCIMIFVFI
jgi:NADH-ubiquinone oxidoreductase chain 1